MVKMGTVWDRTAEFLSDNLGAVLPVALLAIFVPTSIMSNFQDLMNSASPGLKVALALGMVVLGLTIFWGQLAIVAMSLDPAATSEAKAVATRRLPAGIGVSLLVGAIFVLLLIPAFVILAVNGYDFSAAVAGLRPEIPPGAGLPLALYLLVACVLMIWLAARLAVYTPVVVGERRGVGAITRSIALTGGATWKIIGVIILYVVVSSVATMAARAVFGSIFELVAGGDGDVSLASVLTSVIVATVQTGFSVVSVAFVAQLYIALKNARA